MFHTYNHRFDGGDGGVMFASPFRKWEDPYMVGGCTTWAASIPPLEPFSHKLFYEFKAKPGYQFKQARVNYANGAVGIREGSSGIVYGARATTPVNAYAEMAEQPTLEVEVKVEDDIVPAAYAGHYTFSTNGYSPAKKFSTYQVETPTYNKYTELYAVTAAPAAVTLVAALQAAKKWGRITRGCASLAPGYRMFKPFRLPESARGRDLVATQ